MNPAPDILVVDDDDAFRRALVLLLHRLGYHAIEARNGREALSICEVAPPALVLTDLLMPECEGLETIERLRKNYRGVKVVAMSGGGRVCPREMLRVAQLMGAAEVLEKPFSPDELKQTLARLHTPA